MEYRNLGRSGLKVSSLCLGTMTFGEADEKSFMHKVGCDEETSFRIMNKALDAGVNFFDTADVYGQDGLTERVIGKWFGRDGRRDDVVLATKCRFKMQEGPNGSGASRFRIVRAAEASLRRLQTDRIDLYQIHMQDNAVPEDETLRALDDLVRQGKVLYIGCSNYAAYRLTDSLWTSQTQNLERFVSAQMQYSLVERSIEREHVPVCQKFGLGILPWSPLAGGFLSGKYTRGQTPPAGARLERWKDRFGRWDTDFNWGIVDALLAASREVDAPPPAVALAWLLRKPAVTSVIFGARNVEQLDANLRAAEVVLPESVMKRLDDVSTPDWGYPYSFMKTVMGTW
jgi:aryl-alcohol dehydrogenase-like predicted oxidoreductase